jgi:hypothetical protein
MFKSAFAFLHALVLLPCLSAQQADIDFKSQVWPIVKRSCLECHRVPHKNKEGKLVKPKAGLILEHANGIMQGSRDGAVIIPGKPQRSSFYTLTILPDDDDDKMPSKGDPLTKKESDLISKWILQGAEFGDWEGAKNYKPGTLSKKVEMAPLTEERLAENIQAPQKDLLEKARKSKAVLTPLAVNFPLYDATYISNNSNVFDRDFQFLMPLRKHIARLDVHSTKLSKSSFQKLPAFQNLVRLNLRDSAMKDSDLKFLSNLKHLEYLNLYGTKVSNAGLEHLKKLKNLKYLYLRGTKVNAQGVKKLQQSLPKLKIYYGSINQFSNHPALNTSTDKGSK